MSAPANIRRSAGKDDWETPWLVIEAIKRDFGVTFDLDACASEVNHKADKWLEGPCIGDVCWLKADGCCWDMLERGNPCCDGFGWVPNDCACGLCGDHGTGTVFCNPPYSATADWLYSARKKADAGSTEWCLIPVATGSSWWAPAVVRIADEIISLNQRIPFIHPPHCDCKACLAGTKGSNTTDSALVIFRPYNRAKLDGASARTFSWGWRK